MKKITIKILWMIVLLVSVAPLHSMLSRWNQWSQKARSYLTRQVPTVSGVGKKTPLIQQHQQPIDASTWSGWFWSLFQRPPVQLQQPTSYSTIKTPSFEAKDFNSATVQSVPLSEKITSYFEHKSQEKFAQALDMILYGTAVAENERKFTTQDLEKAKQLIDENQTFINGVTKSQYSLGYGYTLPREIRFVKHPQPIYSENSLDRVMRYLSRYINNNLSDAPKDYYSHNLDSIKNYLELAVYIASIGGELSEKKFYEDLYFTKLMPAYRFFYSINSLATEDRYLKDMREIFNKLDPL